MVSSSSEQLIPSLIDGLSQHSTTRTPLTGLDSKPHSTLSSNDTGTSMPSLVSSKSVSRPSSKPPLISDTPQPVRSYSAGHRRSSFSLGSIGSESYPVPADGGNPPKPKTEEPPEYTNNRIYVSNIPFVFREENLKELFQPFGSVLSALIVCNERGSKGFGFVTMDSIESCELARKNLHGAKVLGRTIEVRKATSPPQPRPRGPPQAQNQQYCQFGNSGPTRNVLLTPSPYTTGQTSFMNHNQQQQAQSLPAPASQFIQHQLQQQQQQQQNAIGMLLASNPMLIQNLVSSQQQQQAVAAANLQNILNMAPLLSTQQPLGAMGIGALGSFPINSFPAYSSLSGSSPVMSPVMLPYTAYRAAAGGDAQPMTNATPTMQHQRQGVRPMEVNRDPHQMAYGGMLGGDGRIKMVSPCQSLNCSSNLNTSLLNTSMTAHVRLMQDQLVNMLSLDGTMNNSLYADPSALSVSSGGLLGMSMGDSEDGHGGSSRKRHSTGAEKRDDQKVCRL